MRTDWIDTASKQAASQDPGAAPQCNKGCFSASCPVTLALNFPRSSSALQEGTEKKDFSFSE